MLGEPLTDHNRNGLGYADPPMSAQYGQCWPQRTTHQSPSSLTNTHCLLPVASHTWNRMASS